MCISNDKIKPSFLLYQGYRKSKSQKPKCNSEKVNVQKCIPPTKEVIQDNLLSSLFCKYLPLDI